MASHYEKVFIQHLCIPESLAVIVERDLPPNLLATADLGDIHRFAVEYWHQEGSPLVAPTPDVLREHYANRLAEHEINLDIEPEGILEWCLQALHGAFIDRHWQPIVRDMVVNVGGPEVDILDKSTGLNNGIEKLLALQSMFVRKSEQVDIRRAAYDALEEYRQIAATLGANEIRGATLGLDMIDQHSLGIRDGEMCIVAGPPKSGKSFWLLWAAWQEWLRGGSPVLFTLENSVKMTIARLVCMVLSLDAREFDLGRLTPEKVALIENWVEQVQIFSEDHPFTILQPEPGKRSMAHLIRHGRALGTSIYIDQLTFVEANQGTDRRSKTEQMGILLHEGKALASSGRAVPLIMAHQINREGVKAAEKTGHLEMYHLADSAEVERTADRVYGLWQNAALRDVGRAWIQTLAARRSDLTHWEAEWRPYVGRLRVLSEITLPESR